MLFTYDYGQPLVILQPLQDQYALEGNNVMISCETTGREVAYWVLNRTALSISHPDAKMPYEDLGVLFMETKSDKYYNLTMIAPAISINEQYKNFLHCYCNK